MTDNSDTDDTLSRPLYIFGRDVTKIPCFRNSFLYGISSGIVIGLATFMGTSKPRIASHTGVGSFAVITMSYWTWCRYNYSKETFEARRMQEAVRLYALYQGTDKEFKFDESNEQSDDA